MPQVQSSNYKFSQIGISRFGLQTRSHERQDNSISKSISAHSKTYRRIRLECDYQSGFGQIRILHSVDPETYIGFSRKYRSQTIFIKFDLKTNFIPKRKDCEVIFDLQVIRKVMKGKYFTIFARVSRELYLHGSIAEQCEQRTLRTVYVERTSNRANSFLKYRTGRTVRTKTVRTLVENCCTFKIDRLKFNH